VKVVIRNYSQQWQIDSLNMDTIAAWFRDQIPYLVSVNASLPAFELTVYPSTHAEQDLIGSPPTAMDDKGLMTLSEIFRAGAMSYRAARESAG
jgi:hypothetical protein